MGGVQISPDIKKTSEQINMRGDKVKPFTKQIIQPREPEYVPTAEEQAGEVVTPIQETKTESELPKVDAENMSVKELRHLIESKEDELEVLKKLLKDKVRKLRAELEELESL